MNTHKLVELGLTLRESEAYLALLKLKDAKAGEIAAQTKEDRTNIYDSLRSLIKKGLVNHVIREGRTYYRVASPDKLQSFVEQRQSILRNILPELNNIYKTKETRPTIEVYDGIEGIKTILSDILQEKKDFVGFGSTDRARKLMPEFTKRYMKEREKRGIKARQFCPKGGKVLKSKLSTFKTIPPEFSGPATTIIYGDKVAIFMWFIDPPLAVMIRSKDVAKAYKQQFELMWKLL